MTQEQFFQLIQHPQHVGAISTKDLSKLVEQFPYSQPLRFIYLRQLKEQNSVHYNQQLKLTAISSPDRTQLFNYVNEDVASTVELIPEMISNIEKITEPAMIREPKNIIEERENIIEENNYTPQVSVEEQEYFTEETINETAVKPEPEIQKKEAEEKELSPQDIINQRLLELNIFIRNI